MASVLNNAEELGNDGHEIQAPTSGSVDHKNIVQNDDDTLSVDS